MSNGDTSDGTIGVGFFGQGEEGRFHLERFRLRSDCRCEVAWLSPGHKIRGTPSRLVAHLTESIDEVIENPRVDLIVVDALALGSDLSRSVAARTLLGGKHIMLGFQSFLDQPESLGELAAVANSVRKHIFIPALHRWESTYLGVRSVINNGRLGKLRRICNISRQYVPSELVGTRNLASDSRQALDQLWFRMLDELLDFVPDLATVLSAQEEHGQHVISNDRNHQTQSTQSICGRSVELNFDSECRAHLELSRHSLAPLETGWVLEGFDGGFADRKTYQSTPQFELVDIPIEFPSTDQNGFYDAVLNTIQHGTAFPVTLDSVQKVLELWDNIEQIAKQ